METGQSGQVRARRTRKPDEYLDAMRLSGLLAELARRHGGKGAADELGVSYKTLQRARDLGRLSIPLRKALEQYLLKGPEAPSSTVWERLDGIEALVTGIQGMETEVQGFHRQVAGLDVQVKELGDTLAKELRDVNSRLRVLEHLEGQLRGVERLEARLSSVEGIAAELKEAERIWQAGRAVGSPVVSMEPAHVEPTASESHAVATSADKDGGEALEMLWSEWAIVARAEMAGRTRIDHAIAMERRLELEITLIREHRAGIPRNESWGALERRQELEWRWDALRDQARVRGNLQRLRWLRRVLTLGVWWR